MAVVAGLERDNQFFLENPFYLEKTEEDFKSVVQLIPQEHFVKGEQLLQNYINKMKQDEEEILKNIVGDTPLDKEKVLEALFNKTFDIREAMSYLDNLFARDYGKISISKDNNDNYFMNLLGAKLKLIREGDEYNFKKSLEDVEKNNPDQLKNFKEKVDEFAKVITDGFKEEEEIKSEVYELLERKLLTTKKNKEGGWEKIANFVKKMKGYDNTLSAEFLDFLKTTIGTYSYLRGLFSEAVKVEYEKEMIDNFGGELSKIRGDQLTSKNKKPDVIIQAKILVNPITISQKVASGNHIKLQGSSIANVRRNFYMKEDLILANIFSYLILNDSFSSDDDNIMKKIQLINNYFSYVLLSGLSTDIPIDRAVYFVYSTDTMTKLLPISTILEAILKGEINVEMKPTKVNGSKDDKNKLLGIKDLDDKSINEINKSTIFKKRRTELQNYFREMEKRSDVSFPYELKYYFNDPIKNGPKIEVSKFLAESINPLSKTRAFNISIDKINNLKGIIIG